MISGSNKRLTRSEVLALRGLRLPSAALKGLQRAGIYCQPAISVESRQATKGYVAGFKVQAATAEGQPRENREVIIPISMSPPVRCWRYAE
jgi:hypothetical protein